MLKIWAETPCGSASLDDSARRSPQLRNVQLLTTAMLSFMPLIQESKPLLQFLAQLFPTSTNTLYLSSLPFPRLSGLASLALAAHLPIVLSSPFFPLCFNALFRSVSVPVEAGVGHERGCRESRCPATFYPPGITNIALLAGFSFLTQRQSLLPPHEFKSHVPTSRESTRSTGP